jgi:RND family efflux transporter MFP subunit
MNPVARKLTKFGLPIVVLALAAIVVAALVMTKEEPERKDKVERRVLVTTATVSKATHRLDVEAAGEVIAARDLLVTPQVTGRIEWVNDKLVPGGVVRKGETLFRIEPDNYRIAVEEAQTQIAQAKAQLKQELGRVEVAEREWELFKDEVKGEQLSDPSLALRGPQLESAQVSVDAARARLKRAKLDLERTSVEAPFDAFVQSESADVGQIVGAQSQVANLVGTDAFWVRISVPVEKVNNISIPNVNADTGSEAIVLQEVGKQPVERRGRVIRLLGDLDPQGRMARVLIQIDDPFGLDDLEESKEPSDRPTSKRGIPLLLNSYVNVTVQGPKVDGLIEVPREAIRDGDTAFVVSDEQTLEVREVNVVWKRADSVLVDAGLSDGDRVIVSPIATAVEGMKLRDQSAGDQRAGEQSAKKPADEPAEEASDE